LPLLPDISIIDLEMIDFLIRKHENEQNEENKAQERPFLQVPVPNELNLPKTVPEGGEEEQNNGVVIIDL
jgi:hypothetical protein